MHTSSTAGLVRRNWATSSEFVSSSIPSWQILTAHAQPFRGTRDLAFCLKVPLDSLLVWASSEGSGETARMRRLAWTFAARIGDKYQIRLARPIWYYIYSNCLQTQRNCCWNVPRSELYYCQFLVHRTRPVHKSHSWLLKMRTYLNCLLLVRRTNDDNPFGSSVWFVRIRAYLQTILVYFNCMNTFYQLPKGYLILTLPDCT